MKIQSAVLETVCGITSKLPEHTDPEIAFAGKSNVGKSSLINKLMNRKSLARTSSSPGKTQTINFYRVNDRFFLVDLPGYGYARASAREKQQWGVMIERYLHSSPQLKAVFLLIDIRHEPGENDIQMFRWICACGFTPVIAATKADKISRAEADASVRKIREILGMKEEMRVIPFSAVTGQGREEILRTAAELMSLPEETAAEGTDLPEETAAEQTELPEQTAAEQTELPEEAAAEQTDLSQKPAAEQTDRPEAGKKHAQQAADGIRSEKKRWPKSERGKAKQKAKKKAKRMSHE